MNRNLAWLLLALVALLALTPLLATAGLAVETSPMAHHAGALPPRFLQAESSRLPAMPPESVALPMAARAVAKPFLLLIPILGAWLRRWHCAIHMRKARCPIDLCLLKCYRNHPRQAPPRMIWINTAKGLFAG